MPVAVAVDLAAEGLVAVAADLVAVETGLAGVWALAATVLAAKRRIKTEDFMAWSNSKKCLRKV
jgi:uncharacterized protein YfaQ (DUF2300 family)